MMLIRQLVICEWSDVMINQATSDFIHQHMYTCSERDLDFVASLFTQKRRTQQQKAYSDLMISSWQPEWEKRDGCLSTRCVMWLSLHQRDLVNGIQVGEGSFEYSIRSQELDQEEIKEVRNSLTSKETTQLTHTTMQWKKEIVVGRETKWEKRAKLSDIQLSRSITCRTKPIAFQSSCSTCCAIELLSLFSRLSTLDLHLASISPLISYHQSFPPYFSTWKILSLLLFFVCLYCVSLPFSFCQIIETHAHS